MDDRMFADILDDCLERLTRGETLEQCLERYPDAAAELEPLLKTAQAARTALTIEPRSDFRARARYEFRAALDTELTPKKAFSFRPMPRWATALMVISILLFVGGGTAVVASDSMPDSRLYSVKLVTEKVQLALTPYDMSKAQLCVDQADQRVIEIVYLAGKGDAQQIEAITEDLNERLNMLAALVLPETADDAAQSFTAEAEPTATKDEAMLAPAPTEPLPSPAPSPEEVPPAEEPEPSPEEMPPAEETETSPVDEPPPEEEPEPSPEEVPPAEETETSPVDEPPPAEGATPEPTPAPQAAMDRAGGDWGDDAAAENGHRAELKAVVVNKAVDNSSALYWALINSSDAVQQGLRRAISVSEAGYQRALEALD